MKTEAEIREENAKWFLAQNAPQQPKINQDRIGRIRSSGSGPRWAGLSSFLRETAWDLELKITIESEKTWFREHVLFEVNGPESKLLRFSAIVKLTLEAYNSDREERRRA